MKKSNLMIPAAALLGLLASCGGTVNSMKADVFIYQYSDTYIGTVRTALAADLKAKGIDATFKDAAGVQQTQTQQIDTAIAGKTKLLITNLVEPVAAGENIAKKAKDANVPCIFFNREVENSTVTKATYPDNCFVGTDPDQAGYMQGDILADAIITADGKINPVYDHNGDGKINYVMLRADESNAEANGRTKYSVEKCNTRLAEKSLPALKQLGTDFNANWSKDEAKTAMDNFITAHHLTGETAIEAVIANNDDMALGAVLSLVQAGYNKAGTENDPAKTVCVVGVDATAAAQESIRNKQMYGTVKQDAAAMAACISALAANKLNGKDYLAGTDYKWDSEDVHKIRIPYAKFIG